MDRPRPLSPIVSRSFQRVRTRGTEPELALRSALHGRGLRYRLQWPVPGIPRRSIDIAFPGLEIAVFIDGCFWHGCAAHGELPKNNRDWWREKIESNRKRDRDTDQHLEALGWRVLRFWEHENTDEILEGVIDVVTERRRAVSKPRTTTGAES